MPDKSSFTPDEWKLLLESVMMASIAITAAEPHGLWGLLQESFAGGAELAKGRKTLALKPLITAASCFLKKPFSDERLIDCLDWALKDPVPNTRSS